MKKIFVAFIIGAFSALILTTFSSVPQQQVIAATSAESMAKYLQDAKTALQNGNTTGALRNILTILEWEFNEVHPKIESFLGNVSVTASG